MRISDYFKKRGNNSAGTNESSDLTVPPLGGTGGAAKQVAKAKKTAAPFLNQGNSRDRYMDLSVEKRNWQIAFRLTVGLLAISMGFNGKYMLDSKYVPYLVVEDQLGHVVSVGPADRATPMDIKRVVRSEMIQWVENTRRVVSDQSAQKDFLRMSYARVEENSKAKKALDAFIADTKPFETAANYTKKPEVKYALKRGDNSFEVEWVETRIAPNGDKLPSERWKGVFTYKVSVPETEAAIRANGAGFYLTDFQWQKMAN